MMSKNLFPFVFALLFTVIVYSCKDETIITPPQPMNCNIITPIHSALQLPCTVVYRAEKTGTVTASKITYRDDNGLQVLNNPALPFFREFVLTSRDTASMSVESVVTGGQITAILWAKSQNETRSDTLSCGN